MIVKKWKMHSLRPAVTAGLFLALMGGAAYSADLRIGLSDDPDALDPVSNRAMTGIVVLTAMCDRLLWTDPQLNITPGLATSWSWSADGKELTLQLIEGATFQDGTPFDAAAVKYNLDRARTLPGSQRADDVSTIETVETPTPTTVIIKTVSPSAQLTGKLAERVGIMFSPTAIDALGENIGRAPVCIGPYKFVERIAQDRIIAEKDVNYYDAAKYSFDRVIFRVLPDDTVRLANLQSGEIDMMEKLDPSNAEELQKDARFQVIPVMVLNNQTLVFNLEREGPLQNPKVREALELSIDRQAIVDVAFAGQYQAGNQFMAPDSPSYNSDFPVPSRDPEKSKALLAEAGYTEPVPLTILVPNRPLSVRVGEMIQAMTSDTGFAVKVDVADFATTLQMTDEGNFEMFGPIGAQFANDLDTVAYPILHSTGGRNLSRYKSAEMDKLLDETRTSVDPALREEAFKKASALAVNDRPLLYIYHQKPLTVTTAKLKGFHTTGDGFLRLDGVTLD